MKQIRNYLLAMAATAAFIVPKASATPAGVVVQIDDGFSVSEAISGSVTGANNVDTAINQEGIGALGGFDSHFEFLSNDPNAPAPGSVITKGYNILEADGSISDTLDITITGHSPIAGANDNNNVSVDLHFRSDSLDEVLPPALANGVQIQETGTWQTVDSGLSDLTVSFASDVPDSSVVGAGALTLLGVCVTRSLTLRRRTA